MIKRFAQRPIPVGVVVAIACAVWLPGCGGPAEDDAAPAGAAAMADLKEIGIAANGYIQNQRLRLPRTWADLVPYIGGDLDVLVDSGSGKAAPKWDPETKKLTGGVDYILLDYGPDVRVTRLPSPPECLLAYEDPANFNGRGTYGVYVDGSVKWLKPDELDKLLHTVKEFREKQR